MSLSLLVLLFSECKQDNQKSFNSKKSSRKEESLQLSTNSNNFMRKMKFLSKNHLCNMNLQVETQQKEKEEKEKLIDSATEEETMKTIKVLKTMKKAKIDYKSIYFFSKDKISK